RDARWAGAPARGPLRFGAHADRGGALCRWRCVRAARAGHGRGGRARAVAAACCAGGGPGMPRWDSFGRSLVFAGPPAAGLPVAVTFAGALFGGEGAARLYLIAAAGI